MHSFTEFLSESTKITGGISHLEHPADRLFDGKEATHHALKTLRGVMQGHTPITRKIDDKMSFQTIRRGDGSVGVKYKGSGSTYNFSHKEIDAQHGHKPYLASSLHSVLDHVGKVLPKKPGEYQGGFLSTPETRTEHEGHISHTPNTIEYHTPVNSPEGQKLKNSKVSLVVHTKLKGVDRSPSPITSMAGFRSHPDVHQVQHVVSGEEHKLHSKDQKIITSHLEKAENALHDHDHSHLVGHENSLRTYINSTVRSGESPSVEKYHDHVAAAYDKKIEGVKLEATKAAKTAEKNAALSHIMKNKKAFSKTFYIHHHMQQATNHLADSLDRSSANSGGFQTRISGKPSGGEGYVGGGLKIVNRQEFSKANLARSAILKGSK